MNLIARVPWIGPWLVLQAFAQTSAPAAAGPAAPAPYVTRAPISQTGDTVHVAVNSPRPLEQTLDALRQKYGWVVSYEDPRYTSRPDIVEATSDPSHDKVPAGGNFSVDFPATAPDEDKTLRLVVDAYNHSKNPGQFELRRDAQGNFYVVGTAAHDEKGAIRQQQVLFDLPVTLSTKERTIIETINLICQAIARQSHTVVTVGIYPRSVLDNTPAKLGGTKVPARELLLQSLGAAHRTMYWRLLFDPSSKSYFLSIHGVRRA